MQVQHDIEHEDAVDQVAAGEVGGAEGEQERAREAEVEDRVQHEQVEQHVPPPPRRRVRHAQQRQPVRAPLVCSLLGAAELLVIAVVAILVIGRD